MAASDSTDSIKVHVTRYRDRKNLVLWFRDPITEELVTRFAHTHSQTGKPKCASAHDLRRAFGVRWGRKFRPNILKQLMRHSSITTTMDFYAEEDQDAVADEVWNGSINSSFNSAPIDPEGTTTTQQKNPVKHGV